MYSEKTPDDGQKNCPKHVEFYSKNKFVKLVHIFGFIIRIKDNFFFHFDGILLLESSFQFSFVYTQRIKGKQFSFLETSLKAVHIGI